jgi:GR25 family glycosyltransferase involved in LPS biosynthesis
MWKRNEPMIRSKIAIDLSHFRLLERIVATGKPAVILEDDARIDMLGTQWLPNLLQALQELPEVRKVAKQEAHVLQHLSARAHAGGLGGGGGRAAPLPTGCPATATHSKGA